MAATHMVEQSEALVDFLDELLSEETADTPVDAQENESTEDIIAVGQEYEIDESEQSGTSDVKQAEPALEPDLNDEDERGRKLIIPEWGRLPFQAMVFKVRDLSLAIPLQELAGVIEWQPDQIEQQPGTMLLLGHYQHAGQTVKVVDTARFIFPEHTLAGLIDPQNQSQISRIVLINNGNVGLACDEVFEVVTIQPQQVTWRSAKTRRKWLAGTILAEMTVVLDTCMTTSMLSEPLGLVN